MARRIRTFLLGEAAAFLAAALVHSGALVAGYEHREAGTAESVIALVLLLGLVVSSFVPHGRGERVSPPRVSRCWARSWAFSRSPSASGRERSPTSSTTSASWRY